MSFDRKLSYSSLEAIVIHLTFGKRLPLAVGNRLIRVIHKKQLFRFCVSYLRFDEDHSNYVWKRQNGKALAREGLIRVDTLDYLFKYNRDTDRMEMTCLFGKQEKYTFSRHGATYWFLHSFLLFSMSAVKKLELINCKGMYHTLENKKIESLRVKHHGVHRNTAPFVRGFPKGHSLKKLELENVDIEYLADPNIWRSKRVIVRTSLKMFDDEVKEKEKMERYCEIVELTRLESRFELKYAMSFVIGCKSVMTKELESGSFFTGVFDISEMTKSKMWRCLIETIPNVKNDVIDGRNCWVLIRNIHDVVAVFQDYFGETEGKLCFTVIKMPATTEEVDKTHAEEDIELRLLISNESAEEIEGDGGENMRMLRREFKTARLEMTRFEAHEQVLRIHAPLATIKRILRCILPHLKEVCASSPPSDSSRIIRMLISRSHSVALAEMEKKDHVISTYLNQSNIAERISFGAICAPESTEKVLMMHGSDKEAEMFVTCVLKVLKGITQIGRSKYYEPRGFPCNYGDYGGVPKPMEEEIDCSNI